MYKLRYFKILILFPFSFFAQNLKLEIENSEIVFEKVFENQIIVDCVLKNESKDDYAIVLDTLNFLYRSDFVEEKEISVLKVQKNKWDKQLFQPGIIINNNETKNIGALSNENYFETLPSLQETIKNRTLILKSGHSFKFQKIIGYDHILNQINDKTSGVMLFSYDLEYRNRLEIFLFQNKKLFFENANSELKRKIRREKLKIYSGVLKSNSIPIKFEN